jgi:hypothetical protein
MLWTGKGYGKNKVMRISRQPSSMQNMIDQKQMENLKRFNYLGSMKTNDARCTSKLNPGLPKHKQHSTRRLLSPSKWV